MIYRVWTESFHAQLLDGILYPRWMPDLNGGLGSPTFYFYPPLAFFTSAFFRAIGLGFVSVDVSMGLSIFFAAALGATGAFLLSRDVGASRQDSVLVAIIYTQLPYLFYANLMLRGAYVEFLACCLYPLLTWSAVRTRTRGIGGAPWFALFIAMMLALHPPTALFAIPISLCLALALRARGNLRWIGAATALGCLLPAWYLSTALTHQRYAPHDSMFRPEVLRHSLFLRLNVLSDTKTDLGSYTLNTLSVYNEVVLPAFVLTAVAVLAVSVSALWRKSGGLLSPWTMLFVASAMILLCHPASLFLWETVPILNRVQFAWRLTSTLSLLLALCLALLMSSWSTSDAFRARLRSRSVFWTAVLTAISIAAALDRYPQPRKAGHYEIAKRDVAEHRLTGPVERFVNEEVVFSEDGAIIDSALSLGSLAYATVSAPAGGATVILRQFPYSGWSVLINGSPAQLHDSASGLVQVRVPEGASKVEFRLVRTQTETIGIVASGIAVLALIILTTLNLRRNSLRRLTL